MVLIVGLVGALVADRRLRLPLQDDTDPRPEQGLPDPDVVRLLPDGKTEIGQFATQNRQIIPLERDAAERCRTPWSPPRTAPSGPTAASTPRASSGRPSTTPRGGATQGASTITQQYVKILYLTQERSCTRKIKEAILSLKIQQQLSKQEILEGYLNTIYFGRGAYGVQAAAKAYFGSRRRASSTLQQSAVLASVLNNPRSYDPANGKRNKRGAARAATATCSTAWPRWATITAAEADAGRASSCRSSRVKAVRASTAARRATC